MPHTSSTPALRMAAASALALALATSAAAAVPPSAIPPPTTQNLPIPPETLAPPANPSPQAQPQPTPPRATPRPRPFSPVVDWSGLDDNGRYLLIMGTLDGLAASAQTESPCFPGQTNIQIDARLREAGFTGGPGQSLSATLSRLGTRCPVDTGRVYTTELLQQMSDQHLSLYLGAVIGAWMQEDSCPNTTQTQYLNAAMRAIFDAPPSAPPVGVLRTALQSSCPRRSRQD